MSRYSPVANAIFVVHSCDLQEMKLANGSLARTFSNRTEILLANGTLKRTFHSGCTTVHFANGDIRQSWPDGKKIPSYQQDNEAPLTPVHTARFKQIDLLPYFFAEFTIIIETARIFRLLVAMTSLASAAHES